MQNLKSIFFYSIQLPKKNAAFKLNRIGMDYVMMYLFFLFIIFLLSNFVEQVKANAIDSSIHIKPFFLLIFFFIFNYLIIFIVGLIYISAVAYLGQFVVKLTNRKVKYNILWKMSACITTIPIIIYGIFSFFINIPNYYIMLFFAFHIILLIKIIYIYPVRKHRQSR